ncbi:MAG TPA: hypothetical protein VIM86_03455 [Thermodesulfobacteriota bacterium]
MRRSWYRSAGSAIVMSVWLAVAGCGSVTDDDLHAPDSGTITFNVESYEVNLPPGTCVLGDFFPTPFRATVRNSEGDPLNDIQVTFRLSTALTGFVFLNKAGDIIGLDPVLGISEVVVKSDDDGVAEVVVGVPACVNVADDLTAHSGTAFGSVHISVEEM